MHRFSPLSLPTLKKSFWNACQIEYAHLSSFYIFFFISGILSRLTGHILSQTLPLILLGIALAGWIFCHFIVNQRKREVYSASYRPLFWITTFFALGCLVTSARLAHLDTPRLPHPLKEMTIDGTITDIKPFLNQQTLILEKIRFLNEATRMPPQKIRLTYPKATPPLTVGQKIQAQVYMRPPHTSVYPNAYNESRSLWFQQIGAVGTIHHLDKVSSSKHMTITQRIQEKINSVRSQIQSRIREVLPDETARVTIPLVIGEQRVVSPSLYNLFRQAGIVHVLSVSGFHLTLLSAFVFFFIRGLLILLPGYLERFSAKKPAAVVSLLFSFGYLLISGMQPPAIRSFMMITIVLLGIVFNRNAFSVRSLMIAAFLMLSFHPELILNTGFQLSFTAVLILVTLYHPIMRFLLPRYQHHFLIKSLSFVLGILCLDFLTSFATTPLVLFHFNQFAIYSGIGNLLTGTLFSFWIMPLLLIATILIPFHLDAFFFQAAGFGIHYVLSVCDFITQLPTPLLTFPSFSVLSLCVMLCGIFILCLMQTRLKYTGLLVICLGLVLAITSPQPDLLIGDKGRTIAYRNETTGQLHFLSKGPSTYIPATWLLKNGQNPTEAQQSHTAFARDISHTKLPTLLHLKSQRISFSRQTCSHADICFLPDFDMDEASSFVLNSPSPFSNTFSADAQTSKAPKSPAIFPLFSQQTQILYLPPSRIKSHFILQKLPEDLDDYPWN